MSSTVWPIDVCARVIVLVFRAHGDLPRSFRKHRVQVFFCFHFTAGLVL
jgi:hypothetical protein